MARDSSLVYSTESGRMCPHCRAPLSACTCKNAPASRPSADGIVRVRRETKGRKGKGVTLIEGLAMEDVALMAFVKSLKNRCGSGGTLKNGIVEIQGDHRELVLALLQEKGLKVKLAGG